MHSVTLLPSVFNTKSCGKRSTASTSAAILLILHVFSLSFSTALTTPARFPVALPGPQFQRQKTWPRTPSSYSTRLHYTNTRNGNQDVGNVNGADPFQVLELDEELALDGIVEKKVLKRAYKLMALKFHPDVVTNKFSSAEARKEASDKFAVINWAYATLQEEAKLQADGNRVSRTKKTTDVDSKFRSWYTDMPSSNCYASSSSWDPITNSWISYDDPAGTATSPKNTAPHEKTVTSPKNAAPHEKTATSPKNAAPHKKKASSNKADERPWYEQASIPSHTGSLGSTAMHSSYSMGAEEEWYEQAWHDGGSVASWSYSSPWSQSTTKKTNPSSVGDVGSSPHPHDSPSEEIPESADDSPSESTPLSAVHDDSQTADTVSEQVSDVTPVSNTPPPTVHVQSHTKDTLWDCDVAPPSKPSASTHGSPQTAETPSEPRADSTPSPKGSSVHCHSETTAGRAIPSEPKQEVAPYMSFFYKSAFETVGDSFSSPPKVAKKRSPVEKGRDSSAPQQGAQTHAHFRTPDAPPPEPVSVPKPTSGSTPSSAGHGDAQANARKSIPSEHVRSNQDFNAVRHKSFWHKSAFETVGNRARSSSPPRVVEDTPVSQKSPHENTAKASVIKEGRDSHAPRQAAQSHAHFRTTEAPPGPPRNTGVVSEPGPTSGSTPSSSGHGHSQTAAGRPIRSDQDFNAVRHKSFWYKSAFETVGNRPRSSSPPRVAEDTSVGHTPPHENTGKTNVVEEAKASSAPRQDAQSHGHLRTAEARSQPAPFPDLFSTQSARSSPRNADAVSRPTTTSGSTPSSSAAHGYTQTSAKRSYWSYQDREVGQDNSVWRKSAFGSSGKSTSSSSKMVEDLAVGHKSPTASAPSTSASDPSRSTAATRKTYKSYKFDEAAKFKSFWHGPALDNNEKSASSSSTVADKSKHEKAKKMNAGVNGGGSHGPRQSAPAQDHFQTTEPKSGRASTSSASGTGKSHLGDSSNEPGAPHMSFWYKSAFETNGKSVSSSSKAAKKSKHENAEKTSAGVEDGHRNAPRQGSPANHHFRTTELPFAPFAPPSTPLTSANGHFRTTAGTGNNSFASFFSRSTNNSTEDQKSRHENTQQMSTSKRGGDFCSRVQDARGGRGSGSSQHETSPKLPSSTASSQDASSEPGSARTKLQDPRWGSARSTISLGLATSAKAADEEWSAWCKSQKSNQETSSPSLASTASSSPSSSAPTPSSYGGARLQKTDGLDDKSALWQSKYGKDHSPTADKPRAPTHKVKWTTSSPGSLFSLFDTPLFISQTN